MDPLVFEESGLRVEAPPPAFRLSTLTAYRALSGRSLREMDVCWLDTARLGPPRLLLLELKGMKVWDSPPDDPQRPHEHLVRSCVEKANDTLLMLLSACLPTPWGEGLAQQLPVPLAGLLRTAALKLVFLIDIPATSRELLLAVREEINHRLAGRLGVFSLRHVSVIDFESARKMGLPVTRPPAPPPPPTEG